MKIVPYNAEGKLLRVALVETDEGIDLVFVDADGSREDMILSLSAEGIDLYEEVSEGYGLPLDGKGCVKVVGTPAKSPAKLPADAELRSALSSVNQAIMKDQMYDDDTTLDNADDADLEDITVGDLRLIIRALEKRL